MDIRILVSSNTRIIHPAVVVDADTAAHAAGTARAVLRKVSRENLARGSFLGSGADGGGFRIGSADAPPLDAALTPAVVSVVAYTMPQVPG